MVARWFESTAGDVGTRQGKGRTMTRFEDWVREGTFAVCADGECITLAEGE